MQGAVGEKVNYIKAVEISKAKRVIVVADGQFWQWDRISALLESLGVKEVVEVLDWAHAVGHISKIADIPKNWPQARIVRFRLKLKGHLFDGNTDEIINICNEIATTRRAKAVKQKMRYIQEHAHRMNYKAFKKQGIPTGSGMVESMIRQVINLRLKGCGKFWHKENAQKMLIVRSWWVAGRFDILFDAAISLMAPWWQTHLSSSSEAV